MVSLVSDWWMVGLTALTVVVAAVTLRVFWSQFKEMQTQTSLLNEQAQEASKDEVVAAKRVEEQFNRFGSRLRLPHRV